MTTKIALNDMRFYAYHGVGDQEKVVGNWYRVELTVTLPLAKAIESDCLTDTIDYSHLFRLIKQEMDIPSDLLEHLAGRILKALKAAYPQLTAIELKVSKLRPPFEGELESASVILLEEYN